jgi:transcriptional regulator with XRE-family HTH domain
MENELGNLLREKRIQRGLSLRDVEQRTNITSSYLNRLEKGNRANPSVLMIKKLGEFYGIDEKLIIELATNSSPCKQDNYLNIIEDGEIQLLLNCILKRIANLLVNK